MNQYLVEIESGLFQTAAIGRAALPGNINAGGDAARARRGGRQNLAQGARSCEKIQKIGKYRKNVLTSHIAMI